MNKNLTEVLDDARNGNEYARLYIWALSALAGDTARQLELATRRPTGPETATELMGQAHIACKMVACTMEATGEASIAETLNEMVAYSEKVYPRRAGHV